jgi:uncharacterized membrane protein
MFIFLILTVIMVILGALGILLALGFLAGYPSVVSLPVSILSYFWVGSLTVYFILYAFIATNQPKEITSEKEKNV